MYSAKLHQRVRRRCRGGEPRAIIRKGTDHLDDKSASSDSVGAAPHTEVRVLPEEPRVLFVDADDVLDLERRAIVLDEGAGLRHG